MSYKNMPAMPDGEYRRPKVAKAVRFHDELVKALQKVCKPDWNNMSGADEGVEDALQLLAKIEADEMEKGNE